MTRIDPGVAYCSISLIHSVKATLDASLKPEPSNNIPFLPHSAMVRNLTVLVPSKCRIVSTTQFIFHKFNLVESAFEIPLPVHTSPFCIKVSTSPPELCTAFITAAPMPKLFDPPITTTQASLFAGAFSPPNNVLISVLLYMGKKHL